MTHLCAKPMAIRDVPCAGGHDKALQLRTPHKSVRKWPMTRGPKKLRHWPKLLTWHVLADLSGLAGVL